MPQSRRDSLAFKLNKRIADLGKANMAKMKNWIQENVTIEVGDKENLFVEVEVFQKKLSNSECSLWSNLPGLIKCNFLAIAFTKQFSKDETKQVKTPRNGLVQVCNFALQLVSSISTIGDDAFLVLSHW